MSKAQQQAVQQQGKERVPVLRNTELGSEQSIFGVVRVCERGNRARVVMVTAFDNCVTTSVKSTECGIYPKEMCAASYEPSPRDVIGVLTPEQFRSILSGGGTIDVNKAEFRQTA